ncbi:MAG: hypothetical protein BGO01_02725 [Armatimonadetes bacterium 55-13]|nr:glycoside hydrolase family 127 protein [Armatimonadota bacterium]OJU63581.1 MAG: hypothetical protein BGO01_02725 [Armatimonadetes bacterium 55-13]
MPSSRFLRSLPLKQIKVTDPFWSRWQSALSTKGLSAQYRKLVETNRLRNFENAANQSGEFDGLYFNDSDVYKWAEAAAYTLANHPNPQLQSELDHAISLIQSAQEPSGYINTFFQLKHPDLKWRNLSMLHEMYCGGHLLEAGVALYESLNDRRLLEVSIKFADHLLDLFGPEKRRAYCGHEEIELALLRLAHATGESKYATLARWMVEERGQRPSVFEAEKADPEAQTLSGAYNLLFKGDQYSGEYAQDHAPIREHTEVVGHAVRAMYLYIAAAEIAGEDQDADLRAAIEKCWDNLTKSRMYVTGGIGPSASNEGFTTDYDLPNLSAYAETCAAVGLAMWAQKLLALTGNSEYADIMERAIYNGALSGISLDTEKYFYANPLESRGSHERTPWFTCACCPPNIARLIGSISNYALTVDEKSLNIHLPIGFEATTTLDGIKTTLTAESNYPWSGEFKLTITPEKPVKATLRFRIPDWADDVNTDIPGLESEAEYHDGYIVIEKLWKPGDTAKFEIELKPKWIAADPRVMDNLGRVALSYGPLIYTAEEHDNKVAPQRLAVDVEAEIEIQKEKMLEGITTLSLPIVYEAGYLSDQLYSEPDSVDYNEGTGKFIPYYAWNNRGRTNMQLWVRRL